MILEYLKIFLFIFIPILYFYVFIKFLVPPFRVLDEKIEIWWDKKLGIKDYQFTRIKNEFLTFILYLPIVIIKLIPSVLLFLLFFIFFFILPYFFFMYLIDLLR